MKTDFDYLNQYSLPKEDENGKIVYSNMEYDKVWNRKDMITFSFPEFVFAKMAIYLSQIDDTLNLYMKARDYYHVRSSFEEASKASKYHFTPFFMLWWLNNMLYYTSCALHTYVYDNTEGHGKVKEKAANEAQRKFNEFFK
jgi:hypothetical protein